ncbi:exocyst complex component SEC3B [Physcomitrium patens]
MFAFDDANVHEILENKPLVDEVTQELDETLAEAEDLEEWPGAISVKIRHMREVSSRTDRKCYATLKLATNDK